MEGIKERDNIPSWVITTAKNSLQLEKKQIIEAVEETMYEMNLYESFRTLKNVEQYYQETFVDNDE